MEEDFVSKEKQELYDLKQQYIDILLSTKRENIEDLINYLENHTDFFRAPASAQYHGAQEGFLLRHHLNVRKRFYEIVKIADITNYENSTLDIISLLHDFCKINFYKKDVRNKQINGVWEKVPCYKIEDTMPMGHGEKSVIIAQRFIKLTYTETQTINWHMCGFDDRANSYAGHYHLAEAMASVDLIPLFHSADLISSYIDKI